MKRRRSRRRRCGMVAHMPPPWLKRTPPHTHTPLLLNVAALGATVVVGVLGATVVVES